MMMPTNDIPKHLIQPATSFADVFRERIPVIEAAGEGPAVLRAVNSYVETCGVHLNDLSGLGDPATVASFLDDSDRFEEVRAALELRVTFLDPVFNALEGKMSLNDFSPTERGRLIGLLEGLQVSATELAPYRRFAGSGTRPYGKTWLFYRNGYREVNHVGMPARVAMKPHGHAESWTLEWGQSGKAREETYTKSVADPDAVVFRAIRPVSVSMECQGMIHAITNTSSTDTAEMITVFTPPMNLAAVSVYSKVVER